MTVQQLYDAYALPKDPNDRRENHDALVNAKHFLGRMTISALNTLTGSALPAMQRVQRETDPYNKDNPHMGCALHGCKHFPEHIVVVFRATHPTTIGSTWTSPSF